ncbi:tetratricopeptide repeat protein [Actinopolyspora halophila]|uniref:tetratricopeptide repeat protein n=1 Tax=Actinopolyspora halophila TaxID=1850 RepID=UPI0003621E52|nr:tetratricopeptide repeat protein [Actinopolyspora halophila]
MNTERERLEQHRDQVLRDIVELDQQVADGEIPEQDAQRLRRDYENSAARALAALERIPTEQPRTRRAVKGTITRRAVYAVAGMAAVLAVGVLLPRSLAPRPEGGTVSGNVERSQSEPNTAQRTPSPSRDLSAVSNAEMEAVITRNPRVVGMRMALAERYLEQGDYGKAAEHYGIALKQQPDNPTVLAGAGRLLLAQGKTRIAETYASRALAIAPSSTAGQLLRAEVQIEKPGRARTVRPLLDKLLARPDLDPDLRRRAEELLQSAPSVPEGSR